MNELQVAVKITLANTYVMYAKAQSYHWNVEGMLFPMLHEFFGELYKELSTPIDDLAERIRTLDGYAPVSLFDIINASTITEDISKPSTSSQMLSNLLNANNEVIDSLNKAFQLAEDSNNQGLMEFLAGRLDVHGKHGWMLKATLKKAGE